MSLLARILQFFRLKPPQTVPIVTGAEPWNLTALLTASQCYALEARYTPIPPIPAAPAGPPIETGAKLPDKQPVEGYSLVTGRVVYCFDNLAAAETLGLKVAYILRVLQGGQKEYRGLGWRYCQAKTPASLPRKPVKPLQQPCTVRVPRGARPVEALDTGGKVIATYASAPAAAAATGYSLNAIKRAVGGKALYQGLYWRLTPRSQSPARPAINGRPVGAFTRLGELIKTYPSISAAVTDGNPTSLRTALRCHAGAAGGHYWRYLDTPKLEASDQGTQIIESYDPATGRLVRRYPCLNDVEQDQYEAPAVKSVLNETNRVYRGMAWRCRGTPSRATSPTMPPVTSAEDTAVLESVHRRMELARLARAVFADEHAGDYAVRLQDGRIVHCPTRHEAIIRWRIDEAEHPVALPTATERPLQAASRKARGVRIIASRTRGGQAILGYPSIAEAVRRHEVPYSRIYSAIANGTRAVGYYWRQTKEA